MRILVVSQTYHLTGQKKIWRLKPQKRLFSFGCSRDADLQSIDPGLDSFRGAIEYRDGLWFLFDFRSENRPCMQVLSNKEQFGFQDSTLHLVIDTDRLARTTQLLRFKENLTSYVRYELTEILSYRKRGSWKGPEMRLAVGLFFCSVLTVLLSAVFSDKKSHQLKTEIILSGQKVFIQKQKKNSSQPFLTVSGSQAQQFRKTSGLMAKNSLGSRLTQLIGKVSAAEARTAQLLRSRGLPAGTGPSSRALSNLAKGDFSGQNWAQKAGSGPSSVGTRGVAGGGEAGALATTLSQGATGNGGVVLIEEVSEISGGLDREVIAQYIKTKLGQILYCYERQLSANPDIYGKMNVKFTIAGSGQVESQTVHESTLQNQSVERCVLEKISSWKFPEPKGGIKVVVTYPFIFKSTQ